MVIHSGIRDDGKNFQVVPTTRKIIVPQGYSIIGTVGSHNSELVMFQCPKKIDGHDVTNCRDHFICWENANGEVGRYNIPSENITQDSDYMYLAWVIDCGVTASAGFVKFAIHFEDYDSSGGLLYAWGTSDCTECEILGTTKNRGGSANIPAGYIKPEGTLNITKRGIYDVSGYAFVNVDVVGGENTEAPATPSISINGSILTIIPGVGALADFYEITLGTGEPVAHTSNTTFDLSTCSIFEQLGGGEFTIMARGLTYNDDRSDYSNAVTYVYGGSTESVTEADFGVKTIKVGECIGIGGRQGHETPGGYTWSKGDNSDIIDVVVGGYTDEFYDCLAVKGLSTGRTTLKIHYHNYDTNVGDYLSYCDVYTIEVVDGSANTTTTQETYNLNVGDSIKVYPNIRGKDTGNIAYETIANDGVVSISGNNSEYLVVKALKFGTASIKTSTSNYDENWEEIFGVSYVTINVIGESSDGGNDGGNTNNTTVTNRKDSRTASVEVGKTINLSPAFDSSWDNTGTIKASVTEDSNNGIVSIGDFRFGLYFECTGLKAGTAIVKVNGSVTETDGSLHTCEITYTITVTGGSAGGDDSGDNGNDDKYADAPNFEQQINITEGSSCFEMVYLDSGDWDTPTIERIEVIENDGCVEIEDTVGSEWVSLSGNWSNCATVKYYCHTYDNHLEEAVYFIVTYTIYVDSDGTGAIMSFTIKYYDQVGEGEGDNPDATVDPEFEDGMTWEEWVASGYNTIGAWFDEIDYENHLWTSENCHYINVAKTDVITAGETYHSWMY